MGTSKTVMLGKIKDSRNRGRPNKRWMDFMKEATEPEPTVAEQGCCGTGHCGHISFTGLPGVVADSVACNTQCLAIFEALKTGIFYFLLLITILSTFF